MNPAPRDPEELLLYDGFVRSIARELVRGERAEDVAQDAWVAAMERPPEGSGALGGWWTVVVRRLASKARRGDARRRAREEDAARGERVPSAHELLERESARARVVEAVLALHEPYRSTLVLRYFENRTPRAIAKQLGVPVETVRTRTKRGLELLRVELERDGGRDTWLAALAPFLALDPAVPAAVGSGALATKALPWVNVMSTKVKWLGGALALLLVSLWLYQAFQLASTAAVGANSSVELASQTAPPAVELAPASSAERAVDAAARSVAANGATAPNATGTNDVGALRVRVAWFGGTEPAVGIQARIARAVPGALRIDELREETGASGELLVEGLAPASYSVRVDRGAYQSAEVVAGKTAELVFVLDRGFDVEGTVVDAEHRPVADAEVWLGGWATDEEGITVARSGADGSFFVRAVADAATMGARADGHAPSIPQSLAAGEGATAKLTLELLAGAGVVHGVVLDPKLAPVAGAHVLVGALQPKYVLTPDGRGHMGAGPRELVTDAEGRFRAVGVAAGDVDVAVRAKGFAPRVGSVVLPVNGSAQFDARLELGVGVDGRVVDALGAPVTKAGVRLKDAEGVLANHARTREDGTFELRDLPTGPFVLAVEKDGVGSATIALEGTPGAVLTPTIALTSAGEIRGRVVDERGAPLASWQVQLQDEAAGDGAPDWGTTKTDAEGRFEFVDVHDRAHRLDVTSPEGGYPVHVAHGVRPEKRDVELRVLDAALPSVRIRGRLLDADGKPTAAAHLSPCSIAFQFSFVLTADAATGVFDFGPYSPGEWQLRIDVPDRAAIQLGPKHLAAGETWDVGDVRLMPGGRIRARFERDVELGGATPAVEVLREGWFAGAEFHPARDGLSGATAELPPGDYEVLVHGAFASQVVPVRVESAKDVELVVRLRAGVARQVELELPAKDGAERSMPVLGVRDADGRLVYRRLVWFATDATLAMEELTLAPGEYVLEATTLDGRRATGTLRVDAASAESAPTRLVLR
ncbi:MAG: sigma-70 family RNA polymerase sigma factor [Planctomycetes bacterium]|nr:sigma-70 family RNA polymerase sigma factor [Planctomycetota bacterium]